LFGLEGRKKSVKPCSKDVLSTDAFVMNQNKDFILQNIKLATERSSGILPPLVDESPREMTERRATI
jgi:hypothetical protein